MQEAFELWRGAEARILHSHWVRRPGDARVIGGQSYVRARLPRHAVTPCDMARLSAELEQAMRTQALSLPSLQSRGCAPLVQAGVNIERSADHDACGGIDWITPAFSRATFSLSPLNESAVRPSRSDASECPSVLPGLCAFSTDRWRVQDGRRIRRARDILERQLGKELERPRVPYQKRGGA